MRFSIYIMIGIFSSLKCRAIDWTPIGFVIQPNIDADRGNKNFCLTARSEKANSELVLRKCDRANLDKKSIWCKGQTTSNTIYSTFNTLTRSKACILSPKREGPLLLSRKCAKKNKKKQAVIDWDKNGSIHTIKSNLFTASEVENDTVVTTSPQNAKGAGIHNRK